MQNTDKTRINSTEKSLHKIVMFIGAGIALLTSPILFVIPKELASGNGAILIVIVFPLAGLAILSSGWKMREKFLLTGLTPLMPSPAIGQVGGQIGGAIELPQPWQQRQLKVYLNCINVSSSGSGDNSSSSRSIVWQEWSRPVDKPSSSGSRLEFCFDVPADKPEDGKYGRRGNIHWEVSVEGMVNNKPFKRSWIIPVVAGTDQSSIAIPEIHKETVAREQRQHAEASVAEQIQTKETLTGLDINSEAGRNKSMSNFAVMFGLVFAGVGCFLFYLALNGQTMLWLMAPIFFSLGSGLAGYGIFLKGRKLECTLANGRVFTRRSFYDRVIYNREGPLASADQLLLVCTMGSQSESKKIEYMAIYAWVNCTDGKARKLKLVEGIEGRKAGEVMLEKISAQLN